MSDLDVPLSASKLKKFYWDEEMTLKEIADKAGVSASTVHNWMEEKGIPRREKREAMMLSIGRPAQFRTRVDGYEEVRSWDSEDGYQSVYLHRLLIVAEWGMRGLDSTTQVHHKNGIPWDNRVENLEIVTPDEHAERHAKVVR